MMLSGDPPPEVPEGVDLVRQKPISMSAFARLVEGLLKRERSRS
jgi:hypothetical protein